MIEILADPSLADWPTSRGPHHNRRVFTQKENELILLYWDKMTRWDLAEKLGCHPDTLRRQHKELNRGKKIETPTSSSL